MENCSACKISFYINETYNLQKKLIIFSDTIIMIWEQYKSQQNSTKMWIKEYKMIKEKQSYRQSDVEKWINMKKKFQN